MRRVPLVLDLKGYSLDDGPGIRSVVFFKGCPLKCLWCQNPESWSVRPELSHDEEACIGCGTCVEACPEGAVSTELPRAIDRGRCSLCFECVERCPSAAMRRMGREMSVDEIVAAVVRYRRFFESSGGGVTLSGGEATLFMQFASELLRELKRERLHTLLETCGCFDMARFESLLLPWVDTIYFDIKLLDAAAHRRYCGVGNERILGNFSDLQKHVLEGGFELLPRTPLIPGITDTEANLRAIAGFLRGQGVRRAALMDNNPIWLDKCGKLGLAPPFTEGHPARGFYDGERSAWATALFRSHGIEVAGDADGDC
jgi:pyruvate formate lyase activating enzyme